MYNVLDQNIKTNIYKEEQMNPFLSINNIISDKILFSNDSNITIVLRNMSFYIEKLLKLLEDIYDDGLFKKIKLKLQSFTFIYEYLDENEMLKKCDKINKNNYKYFEETYESFENNLAQFFEQFNNLDMYTLKLRNSEYMVLKRAISHANDMFWSFKHIIKILLENLMKEIFTDITKKSINIDKKLVMKYFEPVYDSFLIGRDCLNLCISNIRTHFNTFIDRMKDEKYYDESRLKMLGIANVETVIKLNTVYENIHSKWEKEISYYETTANAYHSIKQLNKNCLNSGKKKNGTCVINSDQMNSINKRLCDDYEYLQKALNNIENFYLTFFEINHLNENENTKFLFKEILSTQMDQYKTQILDINETLKVYGDLEFLKDKMQEDFNNPHPNEHGLKISPNGHA
ncbi:hypothetical protein COBT_000933 [Conglomerata obtusa]